MPGRDGPAASAPRYAVAEKTPWASTVTFPSSSVSPEHENTPPMLSGSAGVIVMLHSPAFDVNERAPFAAPIVIDSVSSLLVEARLTNEVPAIRRLCGPVSVHVRSIGAGGAPHTAGADKCRGGPG